MTEEKGAELFRRLSAYTSRHIGDPFAILNSRYLGFYGLKTYEQ